MRDQQVVEVTFDARLEIGTGTRDVTEWLLVESGIEEWQNKGTKMTAERERSTINTQRHGLIERGEY